MSAVQINYGIVAMLNGEVVHFTGYEKRPTDEDFASLRKELETDSTFGLVGLENSVELKEVNPYQVAEFSKGVAYDDQWPQHQYDNGIQVGVYGDPSRDETPISIAAPVDAVRIRTEEEKMVFHLTIGDLRQIAADVLKPKCEHEWVDATNEVIESGQYCPRCHAIRATPSAGSAEHIELTLHIGDITPDETSARDLGSAPSDRELGSRELPPDAGADLVPREEP